MADFPVTATSIRISLNGEPEEAPANETVRALVARKGMEDWGGGLAVAINEFVVPHGKWDERTLAEGDRVEMITASQGG